MEKHDIECKLDTNSGKNMTLNKNMTLIVNMTLIAETTVPTRLHCKDFHPCNRI